MPRQQLKTKPTGSSPEADRAARRQQLEAERRAIELEEQRERAEKEVARARHAEVVAQVDELERWQRQFERDEWNREYDRQQEMMGRLRAFVNEPLPTVPLTMAEAQAELAELDRFLDRRALAEQDRLAQEMDAHETRRLHDWDYRRSFDRGHPGRERDQCACAGHRAWYAWRRKD
jgi:hypothetical protein